MDWEMADLTRVATEVKSGFHFESVFNLDADLDRNCVDTTVLLCGANQLDKPKRNQIRFSL